MAPHTKPTRAVSFDTLTSPRSFSQHFNFRAGVQPHPAGGFDVLREMKSIYGQRSKVVHGADYDLEKLLERVNSKVRVVDAAIEHLRLALSILLDHPEFLDVTRIDQEVLLGYSVH